MNMFKGFVFLIYTVVFFLTYIMWFLQKEFMLISPLSVAWKIETKEAAGTSEAHS